MYGSVLVGVFNRIIPKSGLRTAYAVNGSPGVTDQREGKGTAVRIVTLGTFVRQRGMTADRERAVGAIAQTGVDFGVECLTAKGAVAIRGFRTVRSLNQALADVRKLSRDRVEGGTGLADSGEAHTQRFLELHANLR